MAGTWQALTNQPTFNASTMLLLTDGTVMCADEGAGFGGSPRWYRLTPDQDGNYVDGTWTRLADSPNGPLFFASAVLRDGRVWVGGGEYNNGASAELLAAEIYDPQANTWTNAATPAGWAGFGDAISCMLPDGRILAGHLFDNRTAIYDPATDTWTASANKLNASTNEETWTLLPDQTVMSVDCTGHPATEKYVVVANQWVATGNTPVDLIEASSIESGGAVLLPDGRLFAIGTTGATALYSVPPLANQAGTWANGPGFPQVAGQQLGAKDAPASLLPNGKVLCAVGPVDGRAGTFSGPTYFYEYDPAAGTLSAVPNTPNNGNAPFNGRMLLLPTGQILYANGSNDIEVYTPDGTPDPAWAPSITGVPASVRPNHTYTLHGRQLNGLSQAVTYGDDAQMATNYPIVRIRNLTSNHVFYCRTQNHSTMGVQTGTAVHSTQFTVPAGVELGASELCVIANGIPSAPVGLGVSAKVWKELKSEIKELKDFEKGNFKREIDLITREKPDLEHKWKDAAYEVDRWRQLEEDPAWTQVIRALLERSDRLEALVQKSAFIREAQRPAVGDDAMRAAAAEEHNGRHDELPAHTERVLSREEAEENARRLHSMRVKPREEARQGKRHPAASPASRGGGRR
jgi:hypothetical protein